VGGKQERREAARRERRLEKKAAARRRAGAAALEVRPVLAFGLCHIWFSRLILVALNQVEPEVVESAKNVVATRKAQRRREMQTGRKKEVQTPAQAAARALALQVGCACRSGAEPLGRGAPVRAHS
jgi:hypothetical protein